ncbi:MAG: hypothetical protein FD133_1319 [Erysipelotrichaceae bacterium]|nr:MAG: hypothetical protein FD179_1836 [Erysipelotrichaceae bacterium]TXT17557.1 MAG: hypothetical protein FD133_1319 [Erysipelotrichaceae bacterium]
MDFFKSLTTKSLTILYALSLDKSQSLTYTIDSTKYSIMYLGGVMLKIVIGGQMDKQVIANLITQLCNGTAEVSIKSDIEAAIAVQTNQAQYYFGACATGAGGALAMAIGLIGPQSCVSVSIPGRVFGEGELREAVRSGKKAFGFVNYDAEKVIPVLLDEILKK